MVVDYVLLAFGVVKVVFIHARHGESCGRVWAGVRVVARRWGSGAEEVMEEGREGGEVDRY